MDRVKTEITGWMPFWQKDIGFMQDTVESLVSGLCTVYGNNVVLSGCEVDDGGGNLYIGAGWVIIGGELCKADVQVLSSALYEGNLYWRIVETDVPESEREFKFENQISKFHKVWTRRRAVASTDSGAGVSLSGFPYYKKSEIDAQIGSWIDVTNFDAAYLSVGDLMGYERLRVRRAHGTIQIKGAIRVVQPQAANNYVRFTLPISLGRKTAISIAKEYDIVSYGIGAEISGAVVQVNSTSVGLVLIFDHVFPE